MHQPHKLDHLVLGVPDLEEGVRLVEDLTGLTPLIGGRHATGTANYLLGLGDHAYLEIIGILPEERHNGIEQPFQLESLTAPRLTTWCLTSQDIDATVSQAARGGVDLGQVLSLSRTTPSGAVLNWRMTRRTPMADRGTFPFVIDWGRTPHPSSRDLPSARLKSLVIRHPEPDDLQRALFTLSVDPATFTVVEGDFGLEATLETPRGSVRLT